MRAVIQRVLKSNVVVDGVTMGSIAQGILLLLGVEEDDTQSDIEWLSNKVYNMRIFSDDEDKMNLSMKDINGEILVVSQFTLYASTKKGNRPSYIKAAKPLFAKKMYEQFVDTFKQLTNQEVATGIFGADMKVSLINDGPVTIYVDTKNKE